MVAFDQRRDKTIPVAIQILSRPSEYNFPVRTVGSLHISWKIFQIVFIYDYRYVYPLRVYNNAAVRARS